MNPRLLVWRSLTYYWRTNAAVVFGVATAAAVLTGALLVGDSVRGTLRDLLLERLGETRHAVLSPGFFRAALADDLKPQSGLVAPLIVLKGSVSLQGSGGRAGDVQVYGVDERFWRFHGIVGRGAPGEREAWISPALAADLGAAEPDQRLLVRVQRPSDIPLESPYSRKDDAGRTIRAVVREVLPREALGEFSLQAQQAGVRAVFLPLQGMQAELDVEGKVNALLSSANLDTPAFGKLLRDHADLADLDLNLRLLAGKAIALESGGGLLDESALRAATESAREAGLRALPLFTYLANDMRVGEREVPYSLVTAIDFPEFPAAPSSPPPVLLNEWAARDLGAKPGDALEMRYFLWEDPGQLVTRNAAFRVAGIVPTALADPDFAPVYPGITRVANLQDWDPPFPVDLRRIRKTDEDYWEEHTTTPKAFIPLEAGQKLWQSRYGSATSVRFTTGSGDAPAEEILQSLRARILSKIDPLASHLVVVDVRGDGTRAAQGATDFGAYFVYFSFFLMVSALLLSALFFKLNIEQRSREAGLLLALGVPPSLLRRVFLAEGLVLAMLGAPLGAVGGIVYAAALVRLLRTWWIGAVGTDALTLHTSPASLAIGTAGGILAAFVCVVLTLRGLRRVSQRALLAGQFEPTLSASRRLPRGAVVAPILFGGGILLVAAGSVGILGRAGAFFGGSFLLLGAALTFLHRRLRIAGKSTISGSGWRALVQLGFRNASHRPARSIVAIATIASASFLLVAVDSFRAGGSREGTGGYSLLVRTDTPLAQDLNSAAGREALGLDALAARRIAPFRVRPGDDASCLNLYTPSNPRILAPRPDFLAEGRFVFRDSLATDAADRANPWLLLQKPQEDGSIPVIADANSMTYVLHRKLGEEFVIQAGAQSVRLKFVASLSDSIFQSELLMSEENFRRLFPALEGYAFFLVESPEQEIAADTATIEGSLGDFGADAMTTASRLEEFHRVENTYLSTFQLLGALGLLLGTVGLAAVLLRNILERRRELALMRALGYRWKDFLLMTTMENAFLLAGGLLTGVLSAAISVAPAWSERGGQAPASALLLLLATMVISGLLVSFAATWAALRESVLGALKAE